MAHGLGRLEIIPAPQVLREFKVLQVYKDQQEILVLQVLVQQVPQVLQDQQDLLVDQQEQLDIQALQVLRVN
jgi:hypothetical protein